MFNEFIQCVHCVYFIHIALIFLHSVNRPHADTTKTENEIHE